MPLLCWQRRGCSFHSANMSSGTIQWSQVWKRDNSTKSSGKGTIQVKRFCSQILWCVARLLTLTTYRPMNALLKYKVIKAESKFCRKISLSLRIPKTLCYLNIWDVIWIFGIVFKQKWSLLSEMQSRIFKQTRPQKSKLGKKKLFLQAWNVRSFKKSKGKYHCSVNLLKNRFKYCRCWH